MVQKILRSILILVILVGVLYVGARFPLLVQDSDADIFEIFDRPDPDIPDYQQGSNMSEVGHTVVNGVPFGYAVEVVHASVPDVIAYYKKLYAPTALRVFTDEQLEKAGVKEGDVAFKMIRGMETFVAKALPPVFEQVGDTNGFFGVLDRGDNDRFFIKKSDDFWSDVVGKAVIAFKQSPQSNETTVIRFWSEGRLDWDKLIPKPGEDAPGFDLMFVDRHPYARRLFSMGQKDRYGQNQFAVYEVDDAVNGTVLYYLSDLRANGWAISDEVIQAAERSGNPNFFFASREDRELSVYVDELPHGGCMVTFHQKPLQ